MKRVLFVMSNWDAPSEVFLWRQIEMLHDAGILAGIVVFVKLKGVTRWKSVPVYSLSNFDHLSRIRYRLAITLKDNDFDTNQLRSTMFKRIVEHLKPDTILIQYANLAVILQSVLEKLSCKILIHVHGYDTYEHLNTSDHRERLRQLSRHCLIICNSLDSLERLRKWEIPYDRMVLKYLGVEVPDKFPSRPDRKPITILHLGRLVDFKSPDRTIQAFEIASDNGLDGQLIVAGDGDFRTMCEVLRERSKWKERIFLPGAVDRDQGAKYRSQADIFTLHSVVGELTKRVETLGVAVLEAMADGLPVVSCGIGGLLETVVDGQTGILVEPGDIDGQASAFNKLASDKRLRDDYGMAGWNRVRENFSYESERENLIGLINNS